MLKNSFSARKLRIANNKIEADFEINKAQLKTPTIIHQAQTRCCSSFWLANFGKRTISVLINNNAMIAAIVNRTGVGIELSQLYIIDCAFNSIENGKY